VLKAVHEMYEHAKEAIVGKGEEIVETKKESVKNVIIELRRRGRRLRGRGRIWRVYWIGGDSGVFSKYAGDLFPEPPISFSLLFLSLAVHSVTGKKKKKHMPCEVKRRRVGVVEGKRHYPK
jgi:hypothetical protein